MKKIIFLIPYAILISNNFLAIAMEKEKSGKVDILVVQNKNNNYHSDAETIFPSSDYQTHIITEPITSSKIFDSTLQSRLTEKIKNLNRKSNFWIYASEDDIPAIINYVASNSQHTIGLILKKPVLSNDYYTFHDCKKLSKNVRIIMMDNHHCPESMAITKALYMGLHQTTDITLIGLGERVEQSTGELMKSGNIKTRKYSYNLAEYNHKDLINYIQNFCKNTSPNWINGKGLLSDKDINLRNQLIQKETKRYWDWIKDISLASSLSIIACIFFYKLNVIEKLSNHVHKT